jgi:SAM-dependent methyltransferase
MSVAVKITAFETPDTMALRHMDFDTVARPCMIGEDVSSFVLVRNGKLEISYSPRYDHYWFSRCPDISWFAHYYGNDWANPTLQSWIQKIRKQAKDVLRPGYRLAKRLLGRSDAYNQSLHLDYDNYFTVLAPYAKKSAKIMEAGCGLGNHLLPFLRAGFACSGIEPAEVWARTARKRGVRTLVSTIQDTPQIRQMFRESDIVFSNHSMEHHWDPRVLMAMARDNMQPGSIFSITVPNGDACFLLMQNIFMLHLDAYTPASLEALLAGYGFRCIYKSVSSQQLRFVAMRDPDIRQAPAPAILDAAKFREQYCTRFLSQLGVTPADLVQKEKDFSVSFKGARPAIDTDYTLFVPARTMPDVRTIRGHLALENTHDPVIRYVEEVGAAYVALK